MNVSLTPELEAIVQTKVVSGHYTSASEVVREALRLMVNRDEFEALYRDEMRSKISSGVASLKAGRSRDGDTIFDEIEGEIATIEQAQSL